MVAFTVARRGRAADLARQFLEIAETLPEMDKVHHAGHRELSVLCDEVSALLPALAFAIVEARHPEHAVALRGHRKQKGWPEGDVKALTLRFEELMGQISALLAQSTEYGSVKAELHHQELGLARQLCGVIEGLDGDKTLSEGPLVADGRTGASRLNRALTGAVEHCIDVQVIAQRCSKGDVARQQRYEEMEMLLRELSATWCQMIDFVVPIPGRRLV